MSCNVDVVAKRETVSWLIDIIHLEDIDFDTNYTDDTPANQTEDISGADQLDRYARYACQQNIDKLGMSFTPSCNILIPQLFHQVTYDLRSIVEVSLSLKYFFPGSLPKVSK
jgi:hypothetical protein